MELVVPTVSVTVCGITNFPAILIATASAGVALNTSCTPYDSPPSINLAEIPANKFLVTSVG